MPPIRRYGSSPSADHGSAARRCSADGHGPDARPESDLYASYSDSELIIESCVLPSSAAAASRAATSPDTWLPPILLAFPKKTMCWVG